MRKSGDWMSIWDDRILEYIMENDSGAPTQIANSENVHVSKQHISHRLRELADHELLDSIGKGMYRLNKKGEHYLLGNYDAQKQEFIHTEISNIHVRTSPYDTQNLVRVVELNLWPLSEKTAVEQLHDSKDHIRNLISPVLLQIDSRKTEEEVTEDEVKNIIFR